MEQMLSNLKVNQSGKVKNIVSNDITLTKKLLAMGILKGAEISVVKKAFLGDPIEVKIRGYSLSLRKNEAAAIMIEELK